MPRTFSYIHEKSDRMKRVHSLSSSTSYTSGKFVQNLCLSESCSCALAYPIRFASIAFSIIFNHFLWVENALSRHLL